MMDQEFAKWYVNEDWKVTRQAVLNRIDHISDAIQYDMKTNTRPYATRVLLIKEDIIPKPPALTDEPIVPLDFCNLYPSQMDNPTIDKAFEEFVRKQTDEMIRQEILNTPRRGPKYFG